MRESHIGSELKEVAQEVVRFGERCVQAGRNWLNERREDMNNRNNEGRRDYRPEQDYEMGRHQRDLPQRPSRFHSDQSERGSRMQEQGSSRNRGEYYGGSQFNERVQSGWDDDRTSWDYEGGPERYGSLGYGDSSYRHGQQTGLQYAGQFGGQRDYGSQGTGSSDYYRGRQGFGSQESFGSEYNTYGRNQGYGESSGYTRSPKTRFSSQRFGTSAVYGGESVGYGGRGSLGGQDYLDEGEMSGYGGRDLSSQQYGSSSGRYGTATGQYGYGGYGGGYRGVGPKNYTRSDERITEELNERLTDDDDLDASEISVRTSEGKVILEGSVDQRWMKHRAEDIADSCLGVKEVDNRIQVTATRRNLGQPTYGRESGRTSSMGTGAAGTSGSTTGTGGTTPH